MPVLGRTCQAAHFQSEEDADVIERNLGEDAPEAMTSVVGTTAFAEIVVNNHHAFAWPTEGDGVVGECILSSCRFGMLQNLLGRRLPHIDDGLPIQMSGQNLRRTP